MSTPPITFPEASAEGIPLEKPRQPVHDPDNPPWGLLGALGVLALSFMLMLVMQLVFLVFYALRRDVRLDTLGEFALNDKGAIFMQIVAIIPAHLLTLGVAWLVVTRAGKYPFFKMLGWRWGKGFSFWRCVGVAGLMYAVGMTILYFSGPVDNALERLVQSSRGAALATAFAATITAPLVEEIVFRGLLYSSLRRLAGAAWAVTVVVLLFALIHVPQYWPSYGVIATILLLSVVLTLIRAHTSNLLPCFFIHLIFNGVQSVLIVCEPYLKRFIETDPVAPAPAMFAEIVLKLFGAAS